MLNKVNKSLVFCNAIASLARYHLLKSENRGQWGLQGAVPLASARCKDLILFWSILCVLLYDMHFVLLWSISLHASCCVNCCKFQLIQHGEHMQKERGTHMRWLYLCSDKSGWNLDKNNVLNSCLKPGVTMQLSSDLCEVLHDRQKTWHKIFSL